MTLLPLRLFRVLEEVTLYPFFGLAIGLPFVVRLGGGNREEKIVSEVF
jgi:hypothetical protein